MFTELCLTLSKNKKPVYLRIAESLRQAIIQGQLRRNEFLPSTRQLAQSFEVHRHTVMAGIAELVAEGWLTVRERQRYKVSSELPSKFFIAKDNSSFKLPASVDFNWRIVRTLNENPHAIRFPTDLKYNFLSALSDLRLFPHQEFRLFVSDAYKKSPVKMMGYADPQGHPMLLEEIKIYLRRMRAIKDREIIVTHGSQEGIFYIAQLLLKPNDFVAVERLGYFPAWEAFRAAGAKLVPIEIDEDGLKLDSLEKLLKNKKIRLIYVTPLHQFPTTVTLNISRRIGLYQLALKFGVPILEDDYDHEFHYRSQPLAPITSNDPAEQVIYVSTFTKVLYPSSRLGFIAAPKAIAEKIKTFKRITSRQNDTLFQDALACWMKDGGFERHFRRVRRTYEERKETMLACVEKYQRQGLNISCRAPDGGMAIWLNVHCNADELMYRAAKNNLRVASESFYSLKKYEPSHLRLGFSNQTSREIEMGMELLAYLRKKM